MPTILIIGAGPRVGKALAEGFADAGYSVAVASRSQQLDPKFKYFQFDGSKPETVPELFEKVTAEVGVPSCVVYNCMSFQKTIATERGGIIVDSRYRLCNRQVG
jgi:NAD(P)-dependent dehydrogenase (short-subunit alcohol dehydrogenase family)